MADLAKRTFSRGWSPDCDAVNAPPDVLLRADNIVLDELGALVLRAGIAQIGSAFPDLDVHSLFTVVRSAVRLRYAGAGSVAYRNGSPLGIAFDGSGDIQFGSHMGQTLLARGTTNRKDDGTTVRNWGIAMTGTAPTPTAAITGDVFEFATWAETETADHEVEEDDGNGPDYNQDQNGVDNEAIQLGSNATSGRIVVKKTFSSPQDATVLAGGREASDDDIISFFMFADNPNAVIKTALQIDVNGGLFSLDWFSKEWLGEGIAGPDSSVTDPGAPTGGETGPIDTGPGEVPLI